MVFVFKIKAQMFINNNDKKKQPLIDLTSIHYELNPRYMVFYMEISAQKKLYVTYKQDTQNKFQEMYL